MTRIILCLLVTSVAWPGTATAEDAPTLRYGAAETVGMDPDLLDRGVALFRDAVEAKELQGAVLLVARRGTIVLHEAVGWRDRENEIPMERDTLFQMASNTKPIVAAAALMLVDEGKLDLDAPVGTYIPAFNNTDCKEMRVRHLLNHTSGLRGINLFVGSVTEKSDEHPNAPSLLIEAEKFAQVGPRATPGETFRYSNAGYNILAAIIEVVSGRSLDAFLTSRIYAPLGMHNTVNHESQADLSRMSKVYVKGRGDSWTVRWRPGDSSEYPLIRGSGGIVSTAWDYAVFCQMYLNGGAYGDARILNESSVRMATRPQTLHVRNAKRMTEFHDHYGFGWKVYTDIPAYRHDGFEGTYAWVDPARKIIAMIFTQSIGGAELQYDFIEIINDAVESDSPRDH